MDGFWHIGQDLPSGMSRGKWCGGGDLNPYALWALAPQASASANFATSA